MGVSVHLEFSAIFIMQVLFLNFCDLKTLWELLIYSCSQKPSPFLQPDSVRQLRKMLFLKESEPVDFADSVIVVVVSIGDWVPRVPFDQTVNEVLLVLLLNPKHLIQ